MSIQGEFNSLHKIPPFSPLLGTDLCLSDSERVNAFEKAIKETVEEGDVVLDVGSGTGVLSLLALKYGASKVYAIEIDTYLCKRIGEIAKQNGFSRQVKPINSDVLELDSLENHIDVILMEMLTTGLIEEAQVPAYNRLVQKGVLQPTTRIIPESHETYCVPLDYDFTEYGFYMPRAKHITLQDLKNKLANKKMLSTIEFDGNEIDPKVDPTIEYVIDRKGNFNSIGLMSISRLSENVFLGESSWINNTRVVPLDNNLYVKRGDKVILNVQYEMGGGFLGFKAEAQLQ